MSVRLGPGGEFDRIREIARRLGDRASGVGDDCATIPDEPGHLVTSTDLAIEDVHFRRAWLSLDEIGYRAATAALSDLAAAGARCVGLLAALAAPRGTTAADIASVMAGVGAAAAAAGGRVLGGDLTASDRWMLCATVFGRAARPMTRSGARTGDGVWVTGTLGVARAAVLAWEAGREPDGLARDAFARPVARLAAGSWLAANGATAMMDVSDGLAGDAAHLAAASEVHLEIDLSTVPFAPVVAAEAARVGEAPAAFAARGGDDYELLVCLPDSFAAGPAEQMLRDTGVRLTRIGAVAPGEGTRLLLDGRELDLRSYDHFG